MDRPPRRPNDYEFGLELADSGNRTLGREFLRVTLALSRVRTRSRFVAEQLADGGRGLGGSVVTLGGTRRHRSGTGSESAFDWLSEAADVLERLVGEPPS